MSILISELIKKHNLNDANVKMVNERPFDLFARATTIIDGNKCIFLSNINYLESLNNNVSMVITTAELAPHIPSNIGICICENPRGLFFELLSLYEQKDKSLSEKTTYGDNCLISKTAIISPVNVVIGNNVIIGDNVIIRPNTIIGDNTIIQDGAIIGEQDFNVYIYKGITKQIYHSGKVIIGSNVLISPYTLVGQALYSYGRTVIGDGSFIGATTCIGHNSSIGKSCEICGNTMIGGYCSIEDKCQIFMSVSIANALTIGEGTRINIGSVVVRNVNPNSLVFGNPARAVPLK